MHLQHRARLRNELVKNCLSHQVKALVNNNDILKQKIDRTSAANKELNEMLAEKENIIDELQVTEHKALGNNAELERELIEVKMILRKKDVLHEELSSQYQEALARVLLIYGLY